MPPRDWSPRFLASTRGRIVSRLRRGPAVIEELARDVGLTENGVRVHLATLERDGWIYAEGVRRRAGPGKPATEYRLAEGVEPLLSAAYRPVLVALLEALSESQPAAATGKLLRRAGARLAEVIGPLPDGPAEVKAAGLLQSLGGDVAIEPGKGKSFRIVGFGCPVGDAVASEPRVCQAVTALLGESLGATVTEHCERDGNPRCRFEVSPKR